MLWLNILATPLQAEPALPSAPLPYDAVRDTPAAPIPWTRFVPETAPSVYDLPSPEPVAVSTQVRRVPVQAQTPAQEVDPERLQLALRLVGIDGTEAIVRHHVNEVHMRLIVTEVSKYIDFARLSENDRYRLAGSTAVAATELGDRIVQLYAHVHAYNLTREELLELISAYDTEPQRKLTALRIEDTGALDRNAELQMQIAILSIIQQFESR